MKQKPSQHRLGDFLEGKGFYIILLLCVAAIVLGHTSLRRIQYSHGAVRGERAAKIGLVVGGAAAVGGVVYVMTRKPKDEKPARRAA